MNFYSEYIFKRIRKNEEDYRHQIRIMLDKNGILGEKDIANFQRKMSWQDIEEDIKNELFETNKFPEDRNNYHNCIIKDALMNSVVYKNKNFDNIYFYKCNFNDTYFINIESKNVYFINCSFTETSFVSFSSEVSFTDCYFHNIYFKNVSSFRFDSCRFSYKTVFENVDFNNSYFLDIKLMDSKDNEEAFDVRFLNCKVSDTTYIGECQIISFSYFYYHPKSELIYRNNATFSSICPFYRSFSLMFKNEGLNDLYGEYFLLDKLVERMYIEGVEKLKSTISLITCGYGEKPLFCLISSLVIIVFSSILYMFLGISEGNNSTTFISLIISDPYPIKSTVFFFLKCFHFSLVTFATVGYGNITPSGGSYVVSAIEIMLGVIMIGLWTSTLVRKMTR